MMKRLSRKISRMRKKIKDSFDSFSRKFNFKFFPLLKRIYSYLPLSIIILLSGLILWGMYLHFIMGVAWADWTGFGSYIDSDGNFQRGKTLWDLLELLIVPIVLATGAWLLNRSETETERTISQKNNENLILETYFSFMSELLLDRSLRSSPKDSELRHIARIRTLTALRNLSGENKGQVLIFLAESKLINREEAIVDLHGADFSYVQVIDEYKYGLYFEEGYGLDLSNTNISNCNFSFAKLPAASFIGADLARSHFVQADLHDADFTRADLYESNLRDANLSGIAIDDAWVKNAYFGETKLKGAKFGDLFVTNREWMFGGAIMPDGSGPAKWIKKQEETENQRIELAALRAECRRKENKMFWDPIDEAEAIKEWKNNHKWSWRW